MRALWLSISTEVVRFLGSSVVMQVCVHLDEKQTCVCDSKCVCECVYACVCVSVCMPVCVCDSKCVCDCVYACVCVCPVVQCLPERCFQVKRGPLLGSQRLSSEQLVSQAPAISPDCGPRAPLSGLVSLWSGFSLFPCVVWSLAGIVWSLLATWSGPVSL